MFPDPLIDDPFAILVVLAVVVLVALGLEEQVTLFRSLGSVVYDAGGNPVQYVDVEGRVTRVTYDEHDLPRTQTEGVGTQNEVFTTAEYSSDGRLVRETLPLDSGNRVELLYSYDGYDRLTRLEFTGLNEIGRAHV